MKKQKALLADDPATRAVLPSQEECVGYLARQLPEIHYVELRRWDPGRMIDKHAHENSYQFDYFPEGTGNYLMDGRKIPIDARSFFAIAPGVVHAIRSSQYQPLIGLSVKCIFPQWPSPLFPPVFTLAADAIPPAEDLLRQVIAKHVLGQEDHRLVARLRLAELVLFWLGQLHPSARRQPQNVVERTLLLINERFKDPLSLPHIASAVGVSPNHLCRVFRLKTGKTPIEILRQTRVEWTRGQLAAGCKRVGDIAQQAGFGDIQQMNRAFRRVMGVTPRTYLRESNNQKRIEYQSIKKVQ